MTMGDGLGTPPIGSAEFRAVKKAREDALADGLRHTSSYGSQRAGAKAVPGDARENAPSWSWGCPAPRGEKRAEGGDYYQRLENSLTGLAKLYEQDTSKPQ